MTRAAPQADGTYKITGTKIFISSGEHDMTENIVHIVLARLPDAPLGTKGVSLFIVPEQASHRRKGETGERNAVSCAADNMGIHGNATCVMNFDWLPLAGKQIKQITMSDVDASRTGTAIPGMLTDASGQWRCDLRARVCRWSLSGPKPAGPGSSDHCASGCTAHAAHRPCLCGRQPHVDPLPCTCGCYIAMNSIDTAERDAAATIASPCSHRSPKPLSRKPVLVACLGQQIFGGHGYIAEWGMEQNVRDARIASIYEGTTGIQALDFIGRKVLQNGGANLNLYLDDIDAFCNTHRAHSEFAQPLAALSSEWRSLTAELTGKSDCQHG